MVEEAVDLFFTATLPEFTAAADGLKMKHRNQEQHCNQVAQLSEILPGGSNRAKKLGMQPAGSSAKVKKFNTSFSAGL